jgi:hypothetical protein
VTYIQIDFKLFLFFFSYYAFIDDYYASFLEGITPNLMYFLNIVQCFGHKVLC